MTIRGPSLSLRRLIRPAFVPGRERRGVGAFDYFLTGNYFGETGCAICRRLASGRASAKWLANRQVRHRSELHLRRYQPVRQRCDPTEHAVLPARAKLYAGLHRGSDAFPEPDRHAVPIRASAAVGNVFYRYLITGSNTAATTTIISMATMPDRRSIAAGRQRIGRRLRTAQIQPARFHAWFNAQSAPVCSSLLARSVRLEESSHSRADFSDADDTFAQTFQYGTLLPTTR